MMMRIKRLRGDTAPLFHSHKGKPIHFGDCAKFIDIDCETRSRAYLGRGKNNVGAWRYAVDPSTEILLMRYSIDGGPIYGWRIGDPFPKRLLRALKKGYFIRAHNSWFEYCIWNHVGVPRLQWPVVPLERFYCTSATGCSHAFQPGLEDCAEELGLPVKKDKEGKRLIGKFSKPRRAKKGPEWNEPHEHPIDFNHFDQYCHIDVVVQQGIANALPQLSPQEHKVFLLTEKMAQRGLPIDVPMCKGAIELKDKIAKRNNERVYKLTKGKIESATQRAAVLQWLKDNGLTLPDLQAGTIEKVLQKKTLSKKCRKMLILRQSSSKTSTAKYVKALISVDPKDNKVHGSLRYHKARPGRWGGAGIQVQNFTRPTLPKWVDYNYIAELIAKADLETIQHLYGDPMEVLASACRSMIKAPDGHVFVAADYSQIEARITFWFANERGALEAFRRGEDIYCLMASDIYGRTITKMDELERFIGKQCVLGLGFGMGAEKFVRNLYNQFNVIIDLEFAKKVVKIFRKKYRKVKKAWTETENAAKKAICTPGLPFSCANGRIHYRVEGDFLYCHLPSGRKIAYYKPSIDMLPAPWDNNQIIPQITYMGLDNHTRKWVRQATYGGKLFQNYVQGAARDVMVHGMLSAEDKGYPIIFTVHDEAIALIKRTYISKRRALKKYVKTLCNIPKWATGVPVIAEGWIGTRYRK